MLHKVTFEYKKENVEKYFAENNKLIAEFMGLKPNVNDAGKTWTNDEVIIDKKQYSGNDWQILQYHSSMDWLLPVLEKINDYQDVEFKLVGSRASIKVPDGKRFICHTISILNSSYRVVVEFIKWYNKNEEE